MTRRVRIGGYQVGAGTMGIGRKGFPDVEIRERVL